MGYTLLKFKGNLFFLPKKQYLLFLLMAVSFLCKAQVKVVRTGEYLTIPANVDLYILGSFTDSSKSLFVSNNGTMHLTGDLINMGTQNIFGSTASSTGTLRFFGNPASNARIISTTKSPINLKHLVIDLWQPATIGNVLLNSDSVMVYGNVSFLKGGLDIGTHTLRLNYVNAATSRGIIAESDNARPLLLVDNPFGKISVLNYPYSSGTYYPNIMGLGLGFTLLDPLDPTFTSVLSRSFHIQACGDSALHKGSILRVFQMQKNTYAAKYNNTKILYLAGTEMGSNTNVAALHVFVSQKQGQVWSQNLHNTPVLDSVISTDVNVFNLDPTNKVFTAITAATNPCTNLDTIKINQIITTVTPNVTLYKIDSVIVCDTNSIDAHLYATGAMGAAFEWKAPGQPYVPQPSTFFPAHSLGKYWVRMTTNRGCMDSMSVKVVPVSPGNAAIKPQPAICRGTPVTMQPVAAHDTSMTYAWDFGDGFTTSIYNPTHTFGTSGTHTVQLTVTTKQRCISSSTTTVVVNAVPIASFAASAACPGTAILFDNKSTDSTSVATTVSLSWNFGDAITGTSTDNASATSPATGDISHTYTTSGTYTATLVATANGCISSAFSVPVTVYPIPVNAFTFGAACQGQAVSFSNASTISDASPLTYLWDFTGTGPTSASVNPVYTYSTGGTYSVSLTATSTHGCRDSIMHTVTIGQNPIVSFTLGNACINTPVAFASSTPGSSLTYSWNFGDGTTGTLQNESHPYLVAGTYTVTLTVTNGTGCVGSNAQNLVIYPGPNVSYTAQNQCVNVPVNYTNTSTNAVSYSWDFPSLSVTTTQQNPIETFTTAGRFQGKLTATSSNGCQATYIDSVTIYALPLVNLGAAVTTCGTSYTLDAGNAGSSFLWNTGSTTQQYVVTHNSTYTVTVTNAHSCSASSSVPVTLNSVVAPTLGSNSIHCDSTRLDAGYPGATYVWSTGATTQTIKVTTSGTYSVTVTDQNNCTGSASVTITINNATAFSLGPDQVACSSTGVLLNAGTATTYSWNTGATTATLQVPATGYYWVKVSNGAGCSSADTIHVTLNPSPVVTLGHDTTVCNQYLVNAFVSNATYSWNTGATTASITVNNSGRYTVTVTDNTTHCSTKDSIKLVINPLPIVNLGSNQTLCSYQTTTLNAGNPGATYQWNSGQTSQSITVATQGVYSVKVTDANGCSNTGQVSVNIRAVFAINLGPDRPYCTGSTLILDPGLTTSGNTYTWTNTTGTVGTNSTYQVKDTGEVKLTVIDSYQCVAKDSIHILPSTMSLFPEFLVDTKISNNSSDVFVNLSYPHPYTSAWYVGAVLVSTDSSPTISFSVNPPILYDSTFYVTLKVSNQFCISEKTKPVIVHSGHSPTTNPPKGQNPDLFSEIYHVNLFPNPNNGAFTFYIDINFQTYASINIYSISGALVYTENRQVNTGNTTYNFENLSPGIYFFQVTTPNDRRTLKFIKTAN
jgi:PKD repeat protein